MVTRFHERYQGLDRRSGFTTLFVILLCLFFFLVGLDKVNEATDPAFEDTEGYLGGALIIEEHGGPFNFLKQCLSGEYKIAERHPLYLLALSTIASRDLSFFPKAKLVTLTFAVLVIVCVFYVARDLFGTTVAALASLLLALNRSFLTRASHVDCETLLLVCLVLSWYFIVKGFDDSRYWKWAGAAGGLGFMTKATAMYMVPVFLISTLIIDHHHVIRKKSFWAFLLFFVLFSSPLILRNIIVYGSPVYEGNNSAVLWVDRLSEWSDPKYGFIENFKDQTFEVKSLPNMKSYFETHSWQDFIQRVAIGIKGVSALLLSSLGTWLPVGGLFPPAVVAGFCCLGLLLGEDKRRSLLTVTMITMFVLPLSLYFVAIPQERYLIPVVPILLLYAAVGIVEVSRHIAARAMTRVERWDVAVALAHASVIALIIVGIVYVATTQSVFPIIHPVHIEEDQSELLNWLRANVGEEEVIVLGPTYRYWGLLWHANFKGKLIPATDNQPMLEGNWATFMSSLHARNVKIIIVHAENYRSPSILPDYFDYNERDGLIQKSPVPGWQLVHVSTVKPHRFFIYRIK